MRKITLTSHFPAPIEKVWGLLQRSDTLVHVAAPLLTFRHLTGPFPEIWVDGHHEVKLRFLGFVPLGRQSIDIRIEQQPNDVYTILDAGSGRIAKVWDHLITIAPEGDGTRYTDEVTIDAGLLTLPVTLFARVFYGHRQRRWRELLARSKAGGHPRSGFRAGGRPVDGP